MLWQGKRHESSRLYISSCAFSPWLWFIPQQLWSKLHDWWDRPNAKGLIADLKLTPQSRLCVANEKPFVLTNPDISDREQMTAIKKKKCFHGISSTLSFPPSLLQIDAVSLFLLYLVEMICSGLQIIFNTDEVNKALKWLPSQSMRDAGPCYSRANLLAAISVHLESQTVFSISCDDYRTLSRMLLSIINLNLKRPHESENRFNLPPTSLFSSLESRAF